MATAEPRGPVPASLGSIYLIAAAIGVVGIAARVYLSTHAATVVGYVLDAGLLALVIVGVFRVVRSGGRAPLRVSLLGVIYGAVSGLGVILLPPSAATIRRAIAQALKSHPNVNPATVETAMRYSMSTTSHIISAVSTVVIMWLLVLLIAWIASLFIRRPDRSASV